MQPRYISESNSYHHAVIKCSTYIQKIALPLVAIMKPLKYEFALLGSTINQQRRRD